MAVLTAVFRSESLKSLVSEEEYHQARNRTIAFLRQLSPISPRYLRASEILEKDSAISCTRGVGSGIPTSPSRSEGVSKLSTGSISQEHDPTGSGLSPTALSDRSWCGGLFTAVLTGTNDGNHRQRKKPHTRTSEACDDCYISSCKVVFSFPPSLASTS